MKGLTEEDEEDEERRGRKESARARDISSNRAIKVRTTEFDPIVENGALVQVW
jgi:hypothetical protein